MTRTLKVKTWLAAEHDLQIREPISEDETGEATIWLEGSRPCACCPKCGHRSGRVHSRYSRTLHDLPLCDQTLKLMVRVRKFFCNNGTCPRRIFAEQFSGLAQHRARRTNRLNNSVTRIALAVGGEGGGRLAKTLNFGKWSADTLLRMIRRAPDPPWVGSTPRVLGIDDWAKRKGQNYGTILCDLERHCVIDLLPDRETTTTRDWLLGHPGVQIVCRDRDNSYADGIRQGAPEAIQVADRFHLVANLSDAMQRMTERHRQELWVEHETPLEIDRKPPQEATAEVRDGFGLGHRGGNAARLDQAAKDAVRAERYRRIRDLHLSGCNQHEIAIILGVNRQTIRRVQNMAEIPKHGNRRKALIPFMTYLQSECARGNRNANALFRVLSAQGYLGSYKHVVEFVRDVRAKWMTAIAPIICQTADTSPIKLKMPVAPKPFAQWLSGQRTNLSTQTKAQYECLCDHVPMFAHANRICTAFRSLLFGRRPDDLQAWIHDALNTGVPALRLFANNILKDFDAVRAAAAHHWSSGQVEGQINRLKLIKRSMYGRGKLDLLRKRMLYHARLE